MLGAQNMYPEPEGAYTGETSPTMLLTAGCKYVILGHSERRGYFSENDDFVNLKVKYALKFGLSPIICVGEKLEEREANKTEEIVERQVKGAFRDIDAGQAAKTIVAYEPVWAIGTGRAATSDGVDQVIRNVIRPIVAGMVGGTVAEAIRVLYGGSVNPENATEFFEKPEIDGALVGGASLKSEDFVRITQLASQK